MKTLYAEAIQSGGLTEEPAAGAGAGGAPSGVDPMAVALDWELEDVSLPREEHGLSITWTPMRKRGGNGQKGKLPDRIRVLVVKALCDNAEKQLRALVDAKLLVPENSFVLKLERGETNEAHGQGWALWLSNGGGLIAVEACKAFLLACMIDHPEVKNDGHLEVLLVGPSNPRHDPRSHAECSAYPDKESDLPHSYGFDNRDAAFRKKAKEEFQRKHATAGTTGYKKAGHVWRDPSKYEHRIERKNMITIARNDANNHGKTFLGASFFREISWAFQRGEHVVDPGVIVYGSSQLDEIKLEAVYKLNSNPMRAANKVWFTIVLDHGVERLRAHREYAQLVYGRPPWMVSTAIVENMDVYESDHYAATRQLPFRFVGLRRMPRTRATGCGCVVDLHAGPDRLDSRDVVQLMDERRLITARMLYEYGAIVDKRGDLSLSFLATILDTAAKTHRSYSHNTEDVHLPIPVMAFNHVDMVDLMNNVNGDYYATVHLALAEHFGIPYEDACELDASHDQRVHDVVKNVLDFDALLQDYSGKFHGFKPVSTVKMMIENDTENGLTYTPGLHCAVAVTRVDVGARAAPSDDAGPSDGAADLETSRHCFAVIWTVDQAEACD